MSLTSGPGPPKSMAEKNVDYPTEDGSLGATRKPAADEAAELHPESKIRVLLDLSQFCRPGDKYFIAPSG